MFHLTLDQHTTYTLMAMLPLVIQVGALAFAIWVDAYFKPKQKRVFLALLTLVLLLIAQNYLDVMFYKWETGDLARTLTGMLGYLLRPIILLLLYYLVEPEGRFWQGFVLVGCNAVLYLTPLFSPLVFSIIDNGYHGGPLSKTCLIISLALLAGLVVLSVRKARQTKGREIWIPIVLVPIILLSIWLDYSVGYAEQPVTFLTIGIVGCCTLYYLWPHLQTAQLMAMEQREWQRTQLMLSQIKPHFLYNSLTVIRDLIHTDPEAAERAVDEFSEFLRHNMRSIEAEQPILLHQELEHVKSYLALQKLRFGDELQVVYDIACEDMMLPTLTLQPIVENAVSHGIRESSSGVGTVTIRTREYDDHYEITVIDDGCGFDPSILENEDPSHVGLKNVRDRLSRLCGGRLELRTAPSQGTQITIILPKM
jgi:two-component sensor histidine kinase